MLAERNKMVRNVPAWCVEQTGGPKCYPGRDMREAHAHLAVTEREFDVVATEIKTTLYQLNAPEREFDEFRGTIESYRPMVVHRQPISARRPTAACLFLPGREER